MDAKSIIELIVAIASPILAILLKWLVNRGRFIMLAVMIVILPLSAYYLFFVTSQAAYLSERNFRILAGITEHISSKVDTLASSLKSAVAKARQDDMSSVQQNGLPARQASYPESDLRRAVSLISDLTFVEDRDVSTGISKSNSAATASDRPAEPTVAMSVKHEQGSVWLYFEYHDAFLMSAGGVRAKSEINRLFEPFLTQYVINQVNGGRGRLFDEVLVAEQESGRVIFEGGPAGLNVVTLDGLLNDKGGKLELNAFDQSSALVDVTLAGAPYKMFLQPVRLRTVSSSSDRVGGWVVCGLSRTSRFREQTFAFSYTLLIAINFLVVLSVLALPFLRIRLMGPNDRLGRSDLALTLLSAMLGTALITFLFMAYCTHISLGRQLDTQLTRLSSDIVNNYEDEVDRVLLQSKQLNQLMKESSDVRREVEASKFRIKERGETFLGRRTDLLANGIDPRSAAYPFFISASWVDTSSGFQRIKWTTRNDTTAFVRVSDRQYFMDALVPRRMWQRNVAGQYFEYSVEPLISRNTGENVTIIATREPESPWVLSIETRPISLMDTVLPAGYGYAVINNEGTVLFHSDQVKNLEEQFFEECGNDRYLRAAVAASGREFVDVIYLGESHRMFVTPMTGTRWTLVAFRVKSMVRTSDLEMITLSLTLYFGFAVFVASAVFAAGFLLSKRGEQISWLWPDAQRAMQYRVLTTSNALFIGMFLIALSTMSYALLAICCVVLPLSATGLAMLVLKGVRKLNVRSDERGALASRRFGSYRAAYAAMLAGFLLLLGVMPVVGFFQIARAFELSLFLKQGQVSLARGLERRAQIVASRYAPIDIGGSSDAKRAFIEHRLGFQSSWDVYDSFFFDTNQSESNPKVENSPPLSERLDPMSAFLTSVRPLYNQRAIESQGLSRSASADRQLTWATNGDELQLRKELDGRQGEAGIALSSRIPVVGGPSGFFDWLVAILAVSIIVSLVFALVRFVLRHFFMLYKDVPRPMSIAQPELLPNRNLLLLRPPMVVDLNTWNDFHSIDLSQVRNWRQWANALRYKPPKAGLSVVFDHFEHCMEDSEARRETLNTIQRLMSEKRRIVVISTMDPLQLSSTPVTDTDQANRGATTRPDSTSLRKTAGQAGNIDGDRDRSEVYLHARWSAAFSSFVTVYQVDYASHEFLRRDPPSAYRSQSISRLRFLDAMRARYPWRYLEELSKQIIEHDPAQIADPADRVATEELINQVVEQARAYHQALWWASSHGERCTLVQLATDGMVSPKNVDLRLLMKRGLVVRDPVLQIMDEPFRRFVVSAAQSEDVDAWIEAGPSPWRVARVPLFMILISVALFLFLTQTELSDSSLIFLIMATAALAALFRMMGILSTKGHRRIDI